MVNCNKEFDKVVCFLWVLGIFLVDVDVVEVEGFEQFDIGFGECFVVLWCVSGDFEVVRVCLFIDRQQYFEIMVLFFQKIELFYVVVEVGVGVVLGVVFLVNICVSLIVS